MFTRSKLAVSGLALSAFLMAAPAMAADHVDANGMPTDHSTPAEQAQTSALNNQISNTNQAADANAAAGDAQYQASQQQYQGQQQQYQDQMQKSQSAQQQYQDQTARYENLKSRYAAERAAYHRGVWPDRYREWHLQSDARLVGSRVEIVSGDRVGTVESVARHDGNVEALLVSLDSGKVVWIDEADIRFDRSGRVVMTNLDRSDLHLMADERL